jgi:hypothetical protein
LGSTWLDQYGNGTASRPAFSLDPKWRRVRNVRRWRQQCTHISQERNGFGYL